MHQVRRTLTATTNPVVLVVLVWALLWGFGATQVSLPSGPGSAPLGTSDGAPEGARSLLDAVETDEVWQSSWSEQHPGCVALALWPREERPVALLTRRPDGEVVRVASTAAAGQSGRLVGACR